jgi:hypothetical protein
VRCRSPTFTDNQDALLTTLSYSAIFWKPMKELNL